MSARDADAIFQAALDLESGERETWASNARSAASGSPARR